MSLFALFFACSSPTPPPAPVAPTHLATVRVVSYHETDISKREGHPKVHSYATFELVKGDPRITEHAVEGKLNLNTLTTELAKAGPLPLQPGQEVTIAASVVSQSPPYVELVRFHIP